MLRNHLQIWKNFFKCSGWLVPQNYPEGVHNVRKCGYIFVRKKIYTRKWRHKSFSFILNMSLVNLTKKCFAWEKGIWYMSFKGFRLITRHLISLINSFSERFVASLLWYNVITWWMFSKSVDSCWCQSKMSSR